MKQIRYFALNLGFLSLGVLALSACQAMDGLVKDLDSLDLPSMSMSESSAENLVYEGKCPRVEIVKELRAYNEFTDITDPSDYNLISRANIAKINTTCSYDERAVTVDLKMAFEGTLGPRGRASASDKPFVSYPFFVAVTGAGGDIMAKEIFAASMTYDPGQDHQTYYEKMRQIIPVESRDRGARYKIVIGFQLNPDQLAYNREKMNRPKQDKPGRIQTIRVQEEAAALQNTGGPIDITNQP